MAKTVADVMKMVKENEVKFVDFRFTDTRGKEQHVTVPVSAFDEGKFTGGHAFAETLSEHNENVRKWREIEKKKQQGNSEVWLRVNDELRLMRDLGLANISLLNIGEIYCPAGRRIDSVLTI